MESDTIKVVAQTDAFLRIARARPLSSIAELIWNSLDADANNISVDFDVTDLGLRSVTVEDDGQGATPDEAKEFFRRLGGSAETAAAGRLRVLEWRHLDRRSLFICDARGFAFQQVTTRFQLKKHSFSAYLQSPYLDRLDHENRLDLAELDPLASAVIEAAKDAIKAHYDAEDKKEAARIIAEWKASKIYPYEDEPKNEVETAERQVFEIVAVTLTSRTPPPRGSAIPCRRAFSAAGR